MSTTSFLKGAKSTNYVKLQIHLYIVAYSRMIHNERQKYYHGKNYTYVGIVLKQIKLKIGFLKSFI